MKCSFNLRLGLKDIVVGLENDGVNKAYNMEDIQRLKVINDRINNKSVALFSLYPLMVRVFDPVVNGQILVFQYNSNNNTITDKQTGSSWNIDGKSIAGQLKGDQLSRLPFDEGFWFEWAAFHPGTKIYS